MYYNTTNATGETLNKNHKKAASQSEFIVQLFTERKVLSPSDVFTLAKNNHRGMLIGSVRRAISDLTKAGILKKLDKRVISMHDAEEYLWRIA